MYIYTIRASRSNVNCAKFATMPTTWQSLINQSNFILPITLPLPYELTHKVWTTLSQHILFCLIRCCRALLCNIHMLAWRSPSRHSLRIKRLLKVDAATSRCQPRMHIFSNAIFYSTWIRNRCIRSKRALVQWLDQATALDTLCDSVHWLVGWLGWLGWLLAGWLAGWLACKG